MSLSDVQAFAESVLVPIQLFLAMLGMGATLTIQDFLKVFAQPRGLAVGVAMQWLVVPLLAAGAVGIAVLDRVDEPEPSILSISGGNGGESKQVQNNHTT